MGLEKIDVFKREQGLTNDELSKLSGVPKATIDKITSGTTKDPKLETIKALVYSLGHTLDDLDDEKKNAPEPATTSSEAKEEEIYQMLKKLVADLHIDLSALTDRQKIALEIISNIIADNF